MEAHEYFDPAKADTFLSALMGGMSRAQDRHRAKLNTVDENGEVLKAHRGSYKTDAVTKMLTGIDINEPVENICPACEGDGCEACNNVGRIYE